MSKPPILNIQSLGFPWQTIDPFLFCVHHDDAYPQGNANMGPAASLVGRNLGQDFGGKDSWRLTVMNGRVWAVRMSNRLPKSSHSIDSVT